MSIGLPLLGAFFAGLVAAFGMTLFELPFWRRSGIQGVAEWQVNAVIVSVLIRKFTNRRANTAMAVAMHLFHGAVLGIAFRLLPFLPGATTLSSMILGYAILYSVVLWIISPFLTRSSFERSGGFRMTRNGLVVSFLSHIVYGVCLGLLTAAIA
jgi:hypothetical protein